MEILRRRGSLPLSSGSSFLESPDSRTDLPGLLTPQQNKLNFLNLTNFPKLPSLYVHPLNLLLWRILLSIALLTILGRYE